MHPIVYRSVAVNKGYTIAYKGLGPGPHRFDFDVDGSFFAAYGGCGIKDGRAHAEVVLLKKPSMFDLQVTIDGEVTVPCDRCLEDCVLPVHFKGHPVVKFSEEEQDSDGEVIWIHPAEDLLDLGQYIYESIVLSLPYQRVHPLDALGNPLCNPDMLGRFRIVSEAEFDRLAAASEQGAEVDPRWAGLRELKDDDTKKD